MPLHAWLPRAHPIAPAPRVGADERRDDQGRDLRADPRAVRVARRAARSGSARSCSRSALLSALGGVLYALFQHDLKRLLAFHSIENVGIIVLGLGAWLLLRARGARRSGRRSRSRAALLHTLNHAVFKALLFLGAGAFERAVGALELDRLGGLLRRMPWTGGAFLVGAMAIAGLPPLNGFASEWLTLQALLHVPAYGRRRRTASLGAVALAALAATAALAVFCFVKVVGLVLLGPPRRAGRAPRRSEPPAAMRVGRRRPRGRLRRARRRPGLLFAHARRPRAVGGDAQPATTRPDLPGDRLAADRSGSRSRSSRARAAALRSGADAPRGARAELGVRAARRARARCGRAPASRSRCGSCSRRCCGPSARSTVRIAGRRRAGGRLQRPGARS